MRIAGALRNLFPAPGVDLAGADDDSRRTMKILPFLLVLISLFAAPLHAEPAPYRHVVLFKFKDDAPAEKVAAVEKAFAGLQDKIDLIKDLEWGTNVSPEGHDKGFTHCFIVTFKTEKHRDAYLVHPAHEAFVKLVGPVVADVFVIDFWARK